MPIFHEVSDVCIKYSSTLLERDQAEIDKEDEKWWMMKTNFSYFLSKIKTNEFNLITLDSSFIQCCRRH